MNMGMFDELAARAWDRRRTADEKIEYLQSLKTGGQPPGLPPGAPAASIQQRQDHAHDLFDELGVLTRTQLANLPSVDPLIEDTLDRRSMAVLAGYWGTGKSFVALDWACCVATGRPWQGRGVDWNGAQFNRVLYIVGEGAYGVHERIRAWEIHNGADVTTLYVLPRPINLLNQHEVTQLAQLVANESIDLVIIDTLSRCMPGADENSAKDMSMAVKHLDWIKTVREQVAGPDGDDGGGTCVLVVHHTGKDRTTVRGSSVLEASADTVYTIEGDGVLVRLQRTKRKDGPRDDEHTLSIRWVEGTDSAVIRSLSADKTRSSNQDRMLSAFMSAFASTGASKVELRNVVDMPPATFHRALSALVRDGKLVNSGTEKRPFYKLSPDLDLSA
jgi:predicted ATP-dependent serine protease